MTIPPSSAPEHHAGGSHAGEDLGGTAKESIQASIDEFIRRARRARLWGQLFRGATMVMFVTGAVILLGRSLGEFSSTGALWCLVALPLMVPWAWWSARRSDLDSRSAFAWAAAWLDTRAGGTGALVTAAELPDERWDARTLATLGEAPPLPAFQFGRAPLVSLIAAGFCSLSLVVPVPRPFDLPATDQVLERGRKDLAQDLETLTEEIDLENELAQELERRLSGLGDGQDSMHSEGAFEAQDRLAERLEELAQRAQDQAANALEEFQAALAQARAGQAQDAGTGFDEALQELSQAGMGALPTQALERLMKKSDQNKAQIDAADLPSLPRGEAEALERLAQVLGENPALAEAMGKQLSELLAGKLSRLADAGLLRDGALLSEEQRRSLAQLAQELDSHICDENCPPGGT